MQHKTKKDSKLNLLPLFEEQLSKTRDEIFFEPELSENAQIVLQKRYFKKDEEGKIIEDAKAMFLRVAKDIAKAEEKYGSLENVRKYTEIFYQMMANLDFLPNSPTLMNAGKPLQQLSACFVLSVGDSMEEIFDAVKYTALIHKSGGGTGFSFCKLRPKGSVVSSTKGIASGPVSFMRVFDAATETIKQGGTRRGANMGVLKVDHPDILEFIDCKKDQKHLNNFNISVAITDEFMQALYEDREYGLLDPTSGKITGRLSAHYVFNRIIENAHRNGEPGIIFIDRINAFNPTPEIGMIQATNPCGEQPLLPYESCNLGSINLSNFVKNNKEIDFQRLGDVVGYGVRFLDNVIDRNHYPLKQIELQTLGNRKIGLGVMGFADMLIKLGIPYNSEKAVEIAGKVMKFINEKTTKYSEQLGIERGNFPNHYKSIYKDRHPMRNATVTTIAPTGTISIIAGVSSGIEPLFALSFYRNVLDGNKLIEVHPLFKKILEQNGLYNKELINKVAEKGSIKEIKEIPDDIKRVFVTAHDIEPKWHIIMQAEFQKYTANAVSKTVNLHNNSTKDDVKEIYLLAYKLGCKGVTVYRDGSREEQVLVKTKEGKTREVKHPRKRPVITEGKTVRINTGCGKLYVTINEDEFGVCEVFSTMGKAGGCTASQCEAISRLISVSLRGGMDINEIITHLKGISCPNPGWDAKGQILSCADAIATSLELYLESRGKNGTRPALPQKIVITAGGCPSCGGTMVNMEGCATCRVCGFSKCS
ncbi:MAG: vitamin B12-dependent ribonucleotide reductase [Candidatus Hydrogenedentota bacterium]